MREQVQKVVRTLERALLSLNRRNAKFELLQKICQQHPGATVVVAERDRLGTAKAISHHDVEVVSRIPSFGDEELRIVPAWYGQSRMEKLLFGSTADELRLVLYEPEIAWLDQALKRRAESLRLARDVVARSASIPISREHGRG